jgi:hypothetical protein
MALPRVNETLNFSMKIPSTGQRVKYRPYLVKEEKVLLQAFESQNLTSILETMCDTIEACLDVKSKISVDDLATFDVEYMFTQIRASSVGESSDILLKCQKCEHENPVSIDLSTLEVTTSEADKLIQITDDIAVEMKYPSYKVLIDEDIKELDDGNADQIISLVAGSIVAVLTEDERIDVSKESPDEIKDFLNSLTATQFAKVAEFLQDMPQLSHDAEFDCQSCGEQNKVELRGLSDFF